MLLIPAQPYDYTIADPNRMALVIIDMQRDFLEPGGFGEALGNDVGQLQSAIPVVKDLLETFRSLKLTVIHTLECHQADLSDCPTSKRLRGNGALTIGDVGPMGRILIKGEPGNAIVPALAPLADEIVVYKPGKGAFYHTDLATHLESRGITHLIFTGVTTEVCVQTTMREANDRGYECLLIEEGTASYFPQFKQSTLEMIRAQRGIVGWTGAAADLLQALQTLPATNSPATTAASP